MASNTKKILVIGATGGVGKRICMEVIRQFSARELVVADYKKNRGDSYAKYLGDGVLSRYADVNDQDSLEKAIEDIDAVIVATCQKEPNVQSICLKHQVPCFDITFDPTFIEKVKQLYVQDKAEQTSCFVMAGLCPGLSGIMAKWAVDQLNRASSIDVGLMQNTKANVGPSGIADMFGLFTDSVLFTKDGKEKRYPGFQIRRNFEYPQPFGKSTQRLIRYSESQILSKKLGVHDVNYWTGFNKPAFNFFVSILNTVGILKLFKNQRTKMKLIKLVNFIQQLDNSKDETIAVTVEAAKSIANKNEKIDTIKVSIIGPSDYGTTAMCVVSMAKLILTHELKAKGVIYPLEVFPLDLLINTIDSKELTLLKEYK